jgi:hypothetical protein
MIESDAGFSLHGWGCQLLGRVTLLQAEACITLAYGGVTVLTKASGSSQERTMVL